MVNWVYFELIENGWLTRFQKHIELDYCSIILFFFFIPMYLHFLCVAIVHIYSDHVWVCYFFLFFDLFPIWLSIQLFGVLIKPIITSAIYGDATCTMLYYVIISGLFFFMCSFFYLKSSPLARNGIQHNENWWIWNQLTNGIFDLFSAFFDWLIRCRKSSAHRFPSLHCEYFILKLF